MTLSKTISKHNFYSFLWHASFLALAQSFMDVDTIMPAMILESGGTAFHVGLLTAIMLGGASFSQLLLVPYLINKDYKKNLLIAAINIRVVSLFGMAFLLFYSKKMGGNTVIGLIFLLITIFSVSGAFANISYTDILGKAVRAESRKSFFSIKQVTAGIGVFLSAYVARNILAGSSYPNNYLYLFILAAVILGVASLGFWSIKETISSGFPIHSLVEYLNSIKLEIKQNKRLRYYLGFTNTLGLSITILPFLVLFAKEKFAVENIETGNFLILKVTGVVLTGLLVSGLTRHVKYKYLMYLTSISSIFLISLALNVQSSTHFYILFLMGGVIFSSYSISMKGALLEISTNENRALYTGIAGAGSILPALFSLLGGWMIQHYGFNVFFLTFLIIVSASNYFIFKLNCIK